MFEHCQDRDNPDSHNILVPICDECHAWSNHWFHDKENPEHHDFVEPTGELIWGENAHRENLCEKVEQLEDPDPEFYPDGYRHCGCPCHWSKYYVNVYQMTRAYGGPEEGGWWYDCGTVIQSVVFDTYKEAETYRDSIKERFPYTGHRGSFYHDGEDDFDIYIQSHFAPEYIPTETPRYS